MGFLTRKKDVDLPTFPREWENMMKSFFSDSWFPISRSSWNWDDKTFSPKVNVSETENAFEVVAELPGMEEKDIDVTLNNNNLIIKGEKKQESKKEEKDYICVESSYGSFQRSIPVPDVVLDKVEATFKNGVLKVHMPKTEEVKSKTKQIKITN